MLSNMLCGFYQNTDPKSSFTYCFVISYLIDEIYYVLYVKGDTLDYIVIYKEQMDKWYKPVSERSIIDNGYEKFVKFIEKHCVDGLLVSGTRKMVYETICALDTMLNYQA